jgi:TPR repeat protein
VACKGGDFPEAVKCYRKAAESAYGGAMTNLGVCDGEGGGVEKCYKETVRWFRKAAKAGNIDGMNHLGQRHKEGKASRRVSAKR